ncbi:glycosyltransferase [Candidatus Microgenomates bacterium]|nr:glycosyltransferase [Candidatus Microgenomates bacterium]
MKQKKLLLAGSHAATTAAATIVEIKKRKLALELFWVGNKKLPLFGVFFQKIESGKIENKFTRNTILSFLKIPFGFIQAGLAVFKIRPDLILSFGGAAGGQVAFWGWIFRIPVIIHEQTSVAGRANIKSSKFAKKIAISRVTSEKYFPSNKTVLTGDPISKDIVKLAKLSANPEVKTIFITGGSRGSKWINNAIKPILPKLLTKYKIIWQVGEGSVDKFKIKNPQLTIFRATNSSEEYSKYLQLADIVVGRAGANTVSELIIAKKPCILVPIPWSYLDEQTKNAQQAKKLGLARIVKQRELTPEKLFDVIENLVADYPKIIKNTKNLVSTDLSASEKLVNLLEKYL